MTSTPVQSDEELSDNDEVMEQDDDPSYVLDREEIDVDTYIHLHTFFYFLIIILTNWTCPQVAS